MIAARSEPDLALEGFIIHLYADLRRDAMFMAGRLADGRSFAIRDSIWRPPVYVDSGQAARAGAILGTDVVFAPCNYMSFEGRPVFEARIPKLLGFADAGKRLSAQGLVPYMADFKLPDLYRLSRGLRGGFTLEGNELPGRRVDVVFDNPSLKAADVKAPLRVLSIDIETDEARRGIRMVGWKLGVFGREGASPEDASGGLFLGSDPGMDGVIAYDCERSLLSAFRDLVVRLDPDVITGWNIAEFDLPRLAEGFSKEGLRFDIGRTDEPAKVLAASNLDRGRARSTVIIPGRQSLDAMRVARSGPQRFEDYSLDTVARAVLGRGKMDSGDARGSGPLRTGTDKIEALDRLYAESPASFCAYCMEDAALVLDILRVTGLMGLTVSRASLTGLSLERAWTSVAAFEQVYAHELLARRTVPPPFSDKELSGSSGGGIIEPKAGLFDSVIVLDYKSLYPSIMRTFNVDPLAFARAGGEDAFTAPNGARFSRERGPLPEILDRYFVAREEAQSRGDTVAAYVYKILQNSFYGVLASSACRYARDELAGAITSFGRMFLEWSKEHIESRGHRVLYGDTDSVFVASGLVSDSKALTAFGTGLATDLNEALGAYILKQYGLSSRMQIQFDKAYLKFLIPPLRFAERDADSDPAESRGRAKGYAGLVAKPDGSTVVDVKGMEAVRSDWTPLARKFQVDLLGLVFAGAVRAELGEFLARTLRELEAGALDALLVYTRSIRKPVESYTKVEPPYVKAARRAGLLKGRGTISYLMTTDGPMPLGMGGAAIDYEFYVTRQLEPIVRSIASAGADIPLDACENRDGQLELLF